MNESKLIEIPGKSWNFSFYVRVGFLWIRHNFTENVTAMKW